MPAGELCRRAGKTCLHVWCRLSPSPALAFPSSTGVSEPKSSKPQNHGLFVGAGMLQGLEESGHCTGRQHRFSREHCDSTDRSPAPAARAKSRCGAGSAGSFPGLVLSAAGVLRGGRKTSQPKARPCSCVGGFLVGGSWRAGRVSGLSQELSSSASLCASY